MIRVGLVRFPGTNRERDIAIAFSRATGRPPVILWHKETTLPPLDLIVLPGGFSYGDYLRCGAMAAHSPIMPAVDKFIRRGGYVLGVCNGFQILTEAGLLPGALLPNAGLRFVSYDCYLRVERTNTVFTGGFQKRQVFRAALAHGEGNYFADDDTLQRLEDNGQIAFRYTDEWGNEREDANPNGSARNIAGIYSSDLRVLGLMPHPEDFVDPVTGGEDGLPLFLGLASAFTAS